MGLFRVLRKIIVQENLALYLIRLESIKKTADMLALPVAADGTNLGFVSSAFGTGPVLLSSPGNSDTIAEAARFTYPLPIEYVDGGLISVQIIGKRTTGAGFNVAGSLTAYARSSDKDGTMSAELAGSSVDADTANWTTHTFPVTPAGLVSGDLLDVYFSFCGADSGPPSGSIVSFVIVGMLLSVKG